MVVKSTVTVPTLPPLLSTVITARPAFSLTLYEVMLNPSASSLLTIVTSAVLGVPSDAPPVGLDSTMPKTRSGLMFVLSMIGTTNVLTDSPGRNVNVPLVAP